MFSNIRKVRLVCLPACFLCLFHVAACGGGAVANPEPGRDLGPVGQSRLDAPEMQPAPVLVLVPPTEDKQVGETVKERNSERKRVAKKPSYSFPDIRVAAGTYDGEHGEIAACWLPLIQRLRSDNMGDPIYAAYFAELSEYSADPMGVKVKELFTNAYLRKKSTPGYRSEDAPLTRTSPKARIYKNMVTQKTMEKCESFLEEYKDTFDAVEKKYPVPREIIASLIYIETRHGEYLGKASAFWSLACMAAATDPDQVSEGIQDLPITEEHDEWLQAKLTEKSDWAYKELKAFLVYCSTNELDPHAMPGSVYGAIGLCQFMPSNVIPYGEDGDGDGVVDLFSPPDAIFSVARYLNKHGWKKDIDLEQQRKVLRRYNNLMTYANTIITLAESVANGELQDAPSDIPAKKK